MRYHRRRHGAARLHQLQPRQPGPHGPGVGAVRKAAGRWCGLPHRPAGRVACRRLAAMVQQPDAGSAIRFGGMHRNLSAALRRKRRGWQGTGRPMGRVCRNARVVRAAARNSKFVPVISCRRQPVHSDRTARDDPLRPRQHRKTTTSCSDESRASQRGAATCRPKSNHAGDANVRKKVAIL